MKKIIDKYFKYSSKKIKQIIISIIIILVGSIIYSINNPAFLLTFANVTFSIGAVMVCINVLISFRNDHKTFKAYTKEVKSGNEITLDEYKRTTANHQVDVFTFISTTILIIGIIASLILKF